MSLVRATLASIRGVPIVGVSMLAAASAAPAASLDVDLRIERPNVLLILLDDLGNDYVGVYEEGPPDDQPKTPSMDAFARQGIRFVNAYAQPLCSPTRAALLTGRYGFRTGVADNIGGRGEGLAFEEFTLPEALSGAGYRSLMLGKWHVGQRVDEFLDPVLHGFDFFRGTKGNIARYDQYAHFTSWEWSVKKLSEAAYPPTHLTDDALRVIEKLPGPWFLSLNHHLVHRPIHVPPPELHSYGSDPGSEQESFEAMVQALDTELGRLLSRVDLGSTTVFLVGDNGTSSAYSESRQAKGSVFEAGVNVPLIVAGAGVPHRGVVSESLVNVLDLYATTLELAGLPSTAEDSVSILPVLQDPATQVRDWVYAEILNADTGEDRQMIRGTRYKLIRYASTGLEQLFDLDTAPPNFDGDPLCTNEDCPASLDGEARAAYDFLAAAMDELRGG